MEDANEAIHVNTTEKETTDISEAIKEGTECEEMGDTIVSSTLSDGPAIVQPFQLLRKEKVLLVSCIRDYRKRGGQIDWEKVEDAFAANADNYSIFKRRRKRLQSSIKKLYPRNKDSAISSLDNNVENTITSQESDTREESVDTREESVDTREESVDTICEANDRVLYSGISHITEPVGDQRKLGVLDDNEREFVMEYGKKCLLEKKYIDNDRMLKQYKVAFPGFSREGDILKKYWNNWKKDSTAYKEFLRTFV